MENKLINNNTSLSKKLDIGNNNNYKNVKNYDNSDDFNSDIINMFINERKNNENNENNENKKIENKEIAYNNNIDKNNLNQNKFNNNIEDNDNNLPNKKNKNINLSKSNTTNENNNTKKNISESNKNTYVNNLLKTEENSNLIDLDMPINKKKQLYEDKNTNINNFKIFDDLASIKNIFNDPFLFNKKIDEIIECFNSNKIEKKQKICEYICNNLEYKTHLKNFIQKKGIYIFSNWFAYYQENYEKLKEKIVLELLTLTIDICNKLNISLEELKLSKIGKKVNIFNKKISSIDASIYNNHSLSFEKLKNKINELIKKWKYQIEECKEKEHANKKKFEDVENFFKIKDKEHQNKEEISKNNNNYDNQTTKYNQNIDTLLNNKRVAHVIQPENNNNNIKFNLTSNKNLNIILFENPTFLNVIKSYLFKNSNLNTNLLNENILRMINNFISININNKNTTFIDSNLAKELINSILYNNNNNNSINNNSNSSNKINNLTLESNKIIREHKKLKSILKNNNDNHSINSNQNKNRFEKHLQWDEKNLEKYKIFKMSDEPNLPELSEEEYNKIQLEVLNNPNYRHIENMRLKEINMEKEKINQVRDKGKTANEVLKKMLPHCEIKQLEKVYLDENYDLANSYESKEKESITISNNLVLAVNYFRDSDIPDCPLMKEEEMYDFFDENIPKIDNQLKEDVENITKNVNSNQSNDLLLNNEINVCDIDSKKLNVISQVKNFLIFNRVDPIKSNFIINNIKSMNNILEDNIQNIFNFIRKEYLDNSSFIQNSTNFSNNNDIKPFYNTNIPNNFVKNNNNLINFNNQNNCSNMLINNNANVNQLTNSNFNMMNNLLKTSNSNIKLNTSYYNNSTTNNTISSNNLNTFNRINMNNNVLNTNLNYLKDNKNLNFPISTNKYYFNSFINNYNNTNKNNNNTNNNSQYSNINKNNPTENTKYKTKPCNHYHSQEGCKREEKCSFIHNPEYKGIPIPYSNNIITNNNVDKISLNNSLDRNNL